VRQTFPREVRGTADPSTTLPRISCGTWWRCRTSCALLYGRAQTRPCPVQRGRKSGYASVGMTKERVVLPFKSDAAEDEQQVPPLRSPGFPVELGGVGSLHAPFPYRKAHTRPCPVLRGRKSGYATVGMTLLVWVATSNPKETCHPDRSAAKWRDLLFLFWVLTQTL
jgi:hypothetical protein